MAYPKKDYPQRVYGLIKTDKGFSVCEFSVNEEKRIRLVEKTPPDLLWIALDIIKFKAYFQAEKEMNQKGVDDNVKAI